MNMMDLTYALINLILHFFLILFPGPLASVLSHLPQVIIPLHSLAIDIPHISFS